jgi:hypothetical protein
MNNNKTRMALMAVMAIFLVSIAFAPSVTAQATNLDATADKPSGLLVPGGDSGTLTITTKYTGTTPAQATGTLATNSLQMRFSHTCVDTGVFVIGPSAQTMELLPAEQLGNGALSGQLVTNFEVIATPEAKGLVAIQCTTTVEADEFGSAGANKPADAVAQWSTTVDYLSILSVKVDGRVTQAGPQKEVEFPITVTNFGNAQTRVVFQTFERPTNDRWVIGLPDPLVLESKNEADGQEDQTGYTIISSYKTGWNNDQGSFTISMKPTATIGGNPEGEEVYANVIVRVKGVHVPGFEPLALVAAVIGSALVARRQ